MQGELVAQGIELMLYGMGTVVMFLTLLVVATTIMSRFITRYFPEPAPSASAAPQADDPNLVAVITAAIHQHRADRKK